MRIRLIHVGDIRQKEINTLTAVFEKRLSHYCQFETENISPEKDSGKLNAMMLAKKEGERILKKINEPGYTVLFDELGKEMTSVAFSKFISDRMLSGTKVLNLVIGGAFGVSVDVREKSDVVLSLSKMTFTHEMARLFLTEQIYRAMTILKNEKYHH